MLHLPKYSVILFFSDAIEELPQIVEQYIKSGVKVILFTMDSLEECESNPHWRKYKDKRFLETYELLYNTDFVGQKETFIDGNITDEVLFHYLCTNSTFNKEQYLIEHESTEEHLIVKAGAGTGKTTVMVDRILLLKHSLPNFSFESLSMITFTNDATIQMKRKLTEKLSVYFELTNDQKYLDWLEEVYQLNISTIHSFARQLLQRMGDELPDSFDIRSYKYEKRKIVEKYIDLFAIQNPALFQAFKSIPQYKIISTVLYMYEVLVNKSLSNEIIQQLDFGVDEQQGNLLISFLIKNLDQELTLIKKENHQLETNDLIRQLQKLQRTGTLQGKIPFSFLMIDEFQDTDEVQVSFLLWIVEQTNCQLFAVGDTKQSIYRFRGADYTAFLQLQAGFDHLAQPYSSHSLVKNYRSTSLLLDKMNPLFFTWDQRVNTFSFEKDDQLEPITKASNGDEGFCLTDLSDDWNFADILLKLQGKDTAILVRSNQDIQETIERIEDLGFFADGERVGGFYRCESVREFYILLRRFTHSNVYTNQYALHRSSYGSNTLKTSEVTNNYSSTKPYLREWLEKQPDHSLWKEYVDRIKREPLLLILKEIINRVSPASTYRERIYKKMRNDHPHHDVSVQKRESKLLALEYIRSLDHLFYLLQKHFTDTVITLHGIERFIRLKMTTDNSEPEMKMDSEETRHRFKVMTVHRAKGLEFEHVILPLTEHSFIYHHRPRVIVNAGDLKVGYRLSLDSQSLKNDHFMSMVKDEDQENIGEETRLLYVALTRAKRNIYAHVPSLMNSGSLSKWCHLLDERSSHIVPSRNLSTSKEIL
jgi:DNA helicase-2/ATP-dependent DNA helicase PcrA